ncbi:MAG: cysteine-rich KTR domain-containing protein [Lachnospiraceae bacterium]|nr:cysteine-rich KTR domain-containing protein [Lachnospiraceae bacterium]
MEGHDEKPRWIHCPICRGKTRTKVYYDTVLVNFPLYCPKCRREILIDAVQFKMVVHHEI